MEVAEAHTFAAAPTVEAGFELTRETRDDAGWLIARGELDIASAARLDDALRVCDRAAPLFIDLRAVSFCDSTGLAILLRAHRRFEWLTVLAGPAVTRVADIAGVSDLLLGD